MSDKVVIDRITLHLSNNQRFNVKEVETILIMRDLIEIYNFSIVDSLDATRTIGFIMKRLNLPLVQFEPIVDFVVHNFDVIKPMKEERIIKFVEQNIEDWFRQYI
jgi:hypothetical protein